MAVDSLIDFNRFKRLHTSLHSSFEKQKQNEYFNYSLLWSGIFDHRDSTSGISDFLIAFNDRFKFADGIGGSVPESRRHITLDYYRSLLAPELLNEFPMPWLGAPTVLELDGLPVSVPYLTNLRLFSDLRNALTSAGALSRPLHIVEIGAGYGGLAYFLLKSGIAASYTIIDLPENLKISAFFLSQTFKEKPCAVATSCETLVREPAGLSFVSAGNIDAISDWQFDLAINSDSLGEMPGGTAKAYIQWIKAHLGVGGYFFSKNGHRRGPDGVQLPHEYGYQAFDLVRLSPPMVISSLFDDFSHYALLKKSENPKSWAYPDRCFDAICSLYASGLQDELTGLSQAFAENCLSESDRCFLDAVDVFFSASGKDQKLTAFDGVSCPEYKSCILYLKGIASYVGGDAKKAQGFLAAYLPQAQSYIAESYALLGISSLDKSVLTMPYVGGVKTRFAIDEILSFYKLKQPKRSIALRLRQEILRKKINYPGNYSPSTLLKMKNLLFNLREGKGLSVLR